MLIFALNLSFKSPLSCEEHHLNTSLFFSQPQEEKFFIYTGEEKVGHITRIYEKLILKNKEIIKVYTKTVSKINRWFPNKEVTTIDEEYLDEHFRVIKFRSDIFYEKNRITLYGERKDDTLLVRKEDCKGNKNFILQFKNNHYTSSAVHFLIPTIKKDLLVFILDKRDLKWKKVKIERIDKVPFENKIATATYFTVDFGIFSPRQFFLFDTYSNKFISLQQGKIKIVSQ